jgi:hypothetical protein
MCRLKLLGLKPIPQGENAMRSVALFLLVAGLCTTQLFAQAKQVKHTRRPAANAEVSQPTASKPSGDFFSILDGMPMLLELHHDTEVGTNKPIDVYMFVIEMQVMNSDGNLEPIGLQIHNYYTASLLDPWNDVNRHTAADCSRWNKLITQAMASRDPNSKTWPYVEFLTAEGARTLQTNEDGTVFYSDDIQCWGSMDRFSPF